MLFRIEGTNSKRSTHCGVLEFVAEEGVVYMPHWVRAHDAHAGTCAGLQVVCMCSGTHPFVCSAWSTQQSIFAHKTAFAHADRHLVCAYLSAACACWAGDAHDRRTTGNLARACRDHRCSCCVCVAADDAELTATGGGHGAHQERVTPQGGVCETAGARARKGVWGLTRLGCIKSSSCIVIHRLDIVMQMGQRGQFPWCLLCKTSKQQLPWCLQPQQRWN